MDNNNNQKRELNVKEKFVLSEFLTKWEMILVYLLVAVYVIGLIIRPNLFTDKGVIISIVQSGMAQGILALGMYTLFGQGDRDMSCGGLVILVSMVIGLLYGAGIPTVACLIIAVIFAIVCEIFSSYLVAFLDFDAIIVGIAMGTFYRGIVKIVLNDASLTTYPEWFTTLSWGTTANGWIAYSFICFVILSAIFYFVIHKTKFGRELELIGTNKSAAAYSGLNVKKLRMIGYIVFAVMVTIASMFFVGRLGNGINSSSSTGYEFEVIVIATLGTIEINNRRPTVLGIVIASLLISSISYVFGLIGLQSMTRKLITGVILIISVAISKIDKNNPIFSIFKKNKKVVN